MKHSVRKMLMKKGLGNAEDIDVTSQALLKGIWGINRAQQDQLPRRRIGAYLDHCRNQTELASSFYSFDNHKHVVELVDLVRSKAFDDVAEICSAIRQACGSWSTSTFSDHEALQALQYVTKLWLFSTPDLSRRNQSLITANCLNYESSASSLSEGLLSADFSAKSLTRKGGFYVVWTSDLSEHLTFASAHHLRIFRHAHVLMQYDRGKESTFFPPKFLQETYCTIDLLFPMNEYKTSKRIKRIARREQVDIEAVITEKVMDDYERLQLSNYQYYGSRLAEIQRRYDLARPHRLKQWWYDRRQRPEWAALMVALIVFILTVLFGVAQTVTGILQVIAAKQ